MNHIELINILEKDDINIIPDNIVNFLMENEANMENTFGEGNFGKVYRHTFSPNMTIMVKDKEVKIKTIIKEMKNQKNLFNIIPYNQEQFTQDIYQIYGEDKVNNLELNKIIVKNTNVFFCDLDPLGELIILSYLSRLWYESKTPHVPYLVSFMRSQKNTNSFLLDMSGLPLPYTYRIRKIPQMIYDNGMRTTHLENLSNLFAFIANHHIYDEKNDKYVIPELNFSIHKKSNTHTLHDNSKTIDVVELIDSLLLSYLLTTYQLNKLHNIYLFDQQASNIFLCYPKYQKYVGNKKIEHISTIHYVVNDLDKVFRINVKDVILKIGDVGISAMKIRDVLHLITDISGQDMIHKTFLQNKIPPYAGLINEIMNFSLPSIISDKLIAKKIKSDLLDKLTFAEGFNLNYPSELKIVKKYYTNYEVKSKGTDDDKNFNVEI